MNLYLFALIDGGGTVPPELGAVRRLVARGHRVEVLAEDSMVDEVTATGGTFRPWVHAVNRPNRQPEHDPFRDWECRNPLQLISRTLDGLLASPAPAYAADFTAVLHEYRPDLAVCSFFALGAMVAAEAAGVRYDVLMPNTYVLPAAGKPPFGLGAQPASGLMSRIRDRAVTTLVQRQWNKGLDRLNDLRKDYGLEPMEDFWDQVRQANKVLVLTSHSFDFPAEPPSTVRYVGAVLTTPHGQRTNHGHRHPATVPLFWSPCRRRFRIRPTACSGSSMDWRLCPFAASSPPDRPSIQGCCAPATTSLWWPRHRIPRCSSTPKSL